MVPLTPMLEFALELLIQEGKEINPSYLGYHWYYAMNNRFPRAASRDSFGTTTNAYKTLRKLFQLGLANQRLQHGTQGTSEWYSIKQSTMTEERKIGLMLRPRRLLILDYPGNIYELETVFTKKGGWWFNEKHEQGILGVEKFPAIFKEIKWWEHRAPEDMPTHIKVEFEFSAHKVLQVWKIIRWDMRREIGFVNEQQCVSLHNGVTPCTEEFYNQHKTEQHD